MVLVLQLCIYSRFGTSSYFDGDRRLTINSLHRPYNFVLFISTISWLDYVRTYLR